MEGQVKKHRRAKKHGHEEGGHHGGSWKVAYADFVTAMMAFFLLLWLLTMSSDEKRVAVARYFQNFGIFEKSGGAVFESETPGEVLMKIPGTEPLKTPGSGEDEALVETDSSGGAGNDPMSQLMEKFKKEVEDKLAHLADQILVHEFEGGLKIEIMDKENVPMFPSGSSEMSDNGKKILKAFYNSLTDANLKIALEGHTDAKVLAAPGYSNWELSTQRASAARRALEQTGMNPARLIRVSGYAATRPLIKDNAKDPRNRRISIVVFDSPPATATATAPGTSPATEPAPVPKEPVNDKVINNLIEDYFYKH